MVRAPIRRPRPSAPCCARGFHRSRSRPPVAPPPPRRTPPQILVRAALHDAEQEARPRRRCGHPLDAAVEPAVGALGGPLGVLPARVEGRALVERERHVGPQGSLDLHGRLGPHEPLGPVDVRAKADSPSSMARIRPSPPAPPTAPLHLFGDGPVAHREHLEAARVRDDRAVPAHELVEFSEALDALVTGPDEEVERVAEHHPEAERLDLRGMKRLHGGGGGEEERGRPDLAVRRRRTPRGHCPSGR